MTVKLRPSMAALPAYVPGRKVPGAIVLASNESPYGLLPSVASVLAEQAAGVSRYPDMTATRLVEAVAAHHGVDPQRVAVGAGSVDFSRVRASVKGAAGSFDDLPKVAPPSTCLL